MQVGYDGEQSKSPGDFSRQIPDAESHQGSQFFQGKQNNGSIVIISWKGNWGRWEEAGQFVDYLFELRLGRTKTT